MAKKTKKTPKQENNTEPEVTEKKMCLIELVLLSNEDMNWIIYNLSRAGLNEQYEQELQDYGQKEIQPTLTPTEFKNIIYGQK